MVEAKTTMLWLLLVGVSPFAGAFVAPRPYHPIAYPKTSQSSSLSRLCAASTVSNDEELLPGIAAIDQANDDFKAKLEKLRDLPYFRLYSVDILGSCEYMPQELFECYTESCEIYPEDEDAVSTSTLSRVECEAHNMAVVSDLC
jgi:Endoplasmic Reticulum Oxidoreductin 1 (ERO1)